MGYISGFNKFAKKKKKNQKRWEVLRKARPEVYDGGSSNNLRSKDLQSLLA